MSALTWVQSICLGEGQKVKPLYSRRISSPVKSTLQRLMTVEVSKRIGAFFVEYDLGLGLRRIRSLLVLCCEFVGGV